MLQGHNDRECGIIHPELRMDAAGDAHLGAQAGCKMEEEDKEEEEMKFEKKVQKEVAKIVISEGHKQREEEKQEENPQAMVVYAANKGGGNLVQELVEIPEVLEMSHVEPPDIAEEKESAHKKKD
ncbi:hypothetical protein HAX54_048125 [Datura stramonium]|uniref:Uncharacterized protein n=1 Tax=Datura stramonium TaxID=4076 RepID=A0ABS8STL0_DATST|nr:hypothetical protein [Datura stramonium]